MSEFAVPEGDLVEITERVVKATPRNRDDESRFIACRWLRRLFYDVRKWHLEFIGFLKQYPGFKGSRDPHEYQRFFDELTKREDSLDSRYGEAKGDLCANLRMLAARYTIDFRWLFEKDEKGYNELYGLVNAAYASEDGILDLAEIVIYAVRGNVNCDNLEGGINNPKFLDWHIDNHQTVVQEILDYQKRSTDAVKKLDEIAEKAGFRFLTIQEYQAGLSDPRNHPDTMMLGEQIVTERKIVTTNQLKHQSQRLNTILAFSFGVVFIAAILILVVFIPNPTAAQYHVFSVVLALAAGGFGTVLTGMINVTVTLGKRLLIGATGALGVFVIVYFFLPAMTHA